MNKNEKNMVYLKILSLTVLLTIFGCKKNPVEPPPVQESDSTTHNFVWNVDTVGLFTSYLSSVWGTDEKNVYAVGLIYSSMSPINYTDIIHWNGEKWSAINFNDGILEGIYGFSESDIWIAGSWYGASSNGNALLGHYDGKVWTSYKFSQYEKLKAIWGSSTTSMFAVGGNGIILHYDGKDWTSMQSGTQHHLYDIWGISDKDIYTVGGDESQGIGIMLHYDGSSWKTIYERKKQQGNPSGFTSAVWGSSSDKIYVSSSSGEFIGNINEWQLLNAPFEDAYIESIRGYSNKNLFFVGDFGLIVHWNGKSWKRYGEFYKKPYGDIPYGLWVGKESVFIVGISVPGNTGIIYRGKMVQ